MSDDDDEPEVVEMKGTLLPAAPDKCPECAVDHPPELPHNKDSLYYQMKFQQDHGRFPTWEDAWEHCTDEIKEMWKLHMVAATLAGGVPDDTEEQA